MEDNKVKTLSKAVRHNLFGVNIKPKAVKTRGKLLIPSNKSRIKSIKPPKPMFAPNRVLPIRRGF